MVKNIRGFIFTKLARVREIATIEQAANKLYPSTSGVERIQTNEYVYQMIVFLIVKGISKVELRKWAQPCSAFA